MPCKECGSHAINHHCHGRDGSDRDLCDVCYWRKRAQRKPLTNDQIDQIGGGPCWAEDGVDIFMFARAIEDAHGIKGE